MKTISTIKIYFPKAIQKNNKVRLVGSILKEIEEDGMIQYSGYLKKEGLKKDLLMHVGNGSTNKYKTLNNKERVFIEKTVTSFVRKCNKMLPIPVDSFIFVFPWFPSKGDVDFGGSFGFAPYSCVLHIFIDPRNLSKESLIDTLVHEINHIVSYNYHFDRYGRWTLLDYLINEGLAENFREDVVGGKMSPWAGALSKNEALSLALSIKPLLSSRSQKIRERILFGHGAHKKWTGYSIGYWVVKKFREVNKKLSWEEIMRKDPEDIFASVMKNIEVPK